MAPRSEATKLKIKLKHRKNAIEIAKRKYEETVAEETAVIKEIEAQLTDLENN